MERLQEGQKKAIQCNQISLPIWLIQPFLSSGSNTWQPHTTYPLTPIVSGINCCYIELFLLCLKANFVDYGLQAVALHIEINSNIYMSPLHYSQDEVQQAFSRYVVGFLQEKIEQQRLVLNSSHMLALFGLWGPTTGGITSWFQAETIMKGVSD